MLLLDTQANTLDGIYPNLDLEQSGTRGQVDIYRHPAADMHVAMLPGALLAMGPDAVLYDLIDAGYDAIAASPDWLPAGLGNQPISFWLALPEAQADSLSLRFASAVQGGFDLSDQEILTGGITIAYDRAPEYVERYNQLMASTAAAPLALNAQGNIAMPVELPLAAQASRFAVRSLFQAFDGVTYAEQVRVGGNAPWLNFDVGTQPNSIFINYEFASEALRRQFEAQELPAGFQLAPLRILDGEEPGYFMVLNVYRSSGGLVEGARAEWSVFVDDPETGEPRFLVVQAAAENFSADPVNLLTPPEPVSHTLQGDQVVSYVGVENANGVQDVYFRSAFDLQGENRQLRGFDRQFVAANDFIYWGNGVADRGVFNGTVYARDAQIIPASQLTLEDNSRWASYINPAPRHALIYQNPLEIVISPWWNLDADYLDVTPAFRQALIDFSNGFYPATVLAQAEQAARGERPVIQVADEATGSIHVHFRIADPQALMATLGGDQKMQLAPIALLDNGIADYYLTLRLYQLADDTCGTRADWTTYVRPEPDGPTQTLRLLAQSAAPCADADALLQRGSQIALAAKGTLLTVDLAGLQTHFSASLDSALAIEIFPGLAWLEAGDRICGLVLICDRQFINGDTLATALLQVDPSAITIEQLRTPWDNAIEAVPAAVWLGTTPRLRIINPWNNALPDMAP